MNRGTAAVVQLGKNVTAGSFSGLNVLTNVILGKKEALQKDFNGLVLTDLVMLGKKISHITIITVTVGPATSPLLLPDAIENSLKYVKAFGGTEQRNLPDDYVELKSLTSSAGTGAHVNTGVKAASTVKAEFVCDRPTPPASGTVWQVCSAVNDSNGQFAIFESTNAQNTKYLALTYGAASGSLIYVETGSMTKSTFVIDGGVLTYDNGAKTVTSPQAGTTFTTNNDIWLFSRENASVESLSSVTIYSAKFWDNGVLVRNLVCAKRKSDNKLGMYDLVNDNFIECQGTFTAGAAAVPSPDAPVDIVSNNGVLKVNPNLFDETQLLSAGWTLNSSGYYTGSFQRFIEGFRNGFTFSQPFKENTQYTLTCNGYTTSNALRFIVRYTDGSSKNWDINTSAAKDYVFVSEAGKTISRIEGSYGSGTSNNGFLKDVKVMEGTPADEVYVDGLTETIRDSAGHTATAQMLLGINDTYRDEQNINTGAITRKVGVKVFDGTENWSDGTIGYYRITNTTHKSSVLAVCSHLKGVSTGNIPAVESRDGTVWLGSDWIGLGFRNLFTTVEQFKAWLADQYAAGTPVIIVYPIRTPTTESVAGQTLQVVQGDNTLEITQASLTGLELEAQYEQGVQASVQEIEP